jgi:hypothetical protein
MNDKKDKTKNNAETQTSDTAPYIKKDSKSDSSHSESPKSNIVIPFVLLVVLAIIIIATFRDGEYNNLIADTDSQADSHENIVTVETITPGISSEEPTSSEEPATSNNIKQNIAITPEETSSIIEAETASADEESKVKQLTNNVVAIQANPANNYASSQHIPPAYKEAREQAKARSQEQARKYNEMMQQRRQAYEKEMQSKQQQYEAAMKAHQKRLAEMAEVQKAAFQRAKQNRLETKQKIQEMHKQISDLHNEIHKIMRSQHITFNEPHTTQIQQNPVVK